MCKSTGAVGNQTFHLFWDKGVSWDIWLLVLKLEQSQPRQFRAVDHLRSVPDRWNRKNKGPEREACWVVSGTSNERRVWLERGWRRWCEGVTSCRALERLQWYSTQTRSSGLMPPSLAAASRLTGYFSMLLALDYKELLPPRLCPCQGAAHD